LIAWVGDMGQAPQADESIDLGGRAVFPGWVDSHSHLIFGGDRAEEFVARMAGQSYAPGGVAVTTSATSQPSDNELSEAVAARRAGALAMGTTSMETKPGYGLAVDEATRHSVLGQPLVDSLTSPA